MLEMLVTLNFGSLFLISFLPGALSQTLSFSSSVFSFTVPSGIKPNTVVGKASVNYPTGTVWTIPYASGNFGVTFYTGDVITINDLQPCSTYSVVVRASNSQRGNNYTTVNVQTTCPLDSSSIPAFSQSSGYTLSVGGCPINGYLGVVSASRATSYSLASPYFNIHPFTGQITLTGAPPTSPNIVSVVASNAAGSRTIPVTVYTSGCVGVVPATGTAPTFTQTAYAFTATNCVTGSFIGRVSATSTSGPVTYSLGGGSSFFTINASGQILVSGVPPVAGTTQTVNVMATSGTRTSMVPVTITIPATCPGAQSGPDVG